MIGIVFIYQAACCAANLLTGAGFRPAPTWQLAVSTTVPFGQLAVGVRQIKRADHTALRVSYQSARYVAIPKSFDDGIKRDIRAYR